MTATVLFVDDEAMVLQALRRALRGQPIDWDMHFCDSATSALQLLEHERVDVVVSDMQMPEIDGAELLARARAMQPQTVRVVLSGFKDKTVAFQTVSAHRLLTKPIMCTSLVQQIDAALEGAAGATSNRRLVTETDLLPTTRQSLQNLREALASRTARAHDIVRVALGDPVLAVKLLQLGNSGLLGNRPAGADISACVSAIGMDTLRALVESSSIANAFDIDDPRDAQVVALQQHAREAALGKTAEAALGPLVHVVGSLLALGSDEPSASGSPPCANNFDLTCSLLRLWGIPNSVVDAVDTCH
jgi:DNA-binding NarL/FixJ family response regulator